MKSTDIIPPFVITFCNSHQLNSITRVAGTWFARDRTQQWIRIPLAGGSLTLDGITVCIPNCWSYKKAWGADLFAPAFGLPPTVICARFLSGDGQQQLLIDTTVPLLTQAAFRYWFAANFDALLLFVENTVYS